MTAVSMLETSTWRGRTVIDSRGDRIGRVEDVYAERDTGEPMWAVVHTGLLGIKRNIVPVTEVRTVGDAFVQLPYTEEKVTNAPAVDPGEQLSDDEVRALNEYYGDHG